MAASPCLPGKAHYWLVVGPYYDADYGYQVERLTCQHCGTERVQQAYSMPAAMMASIKRGGRTTKWQKEAKNGQA